MANEEILSLKIKDDGTIYDEHGHTVTKENGTTQVLNIDGRKCMYFNGGNYLKVLTDERFNLTGDFTIEFWLKLDGKHYNASGYYPCVLCTKNTWSSGTSQILICWSNSEEEKNGIQITSYDGSDYCGIKLKEEPTKWNHFSIICNNKKILIYQNGYLLNNVIWSNYTDGYNFNYDGFIVVGQKGTNSGYEGSLYGYLSDLKISTFAKDTTYIKQDNKYYGVSDDNYSNLIQHFDLSETINENNILLDKSYNSNNSLIVSSPPTIEYDEQLKRNVSVFNGTSNYIPIGKTSKVTDVITINALAYTDDWSKPLGRIISCTQSGGWNFFNDYKRSFYIAINSNYTIYECPLEKLLNGWNMITMSFDGYSVKYYINGILINTIEVSNIKSKITYDSTNGIFIGVEAYSGSETSIETNPVFDNGAFFKGKIADIRIYNEALSNSNIKILYNYLMYKEYNYIKQDNKYYGFSNDNYDTTAKMYKEVTLDDIKNLKYGNSILNLTKETTIGDETFKPIDKFTNFQLISSYDNKPKTVIGSKSKSGLIVANGNIYAGKISDKINSFTLDRTVNNNSAIKMAVSFDNGSTWKTYKDGTFQELSITIPNKYYTNMTDEEKTNYSNAKTTILESGFNASNLSSIDFNIDNLDTIRFAYVLYQDSINDDCKMSDLSWNFNAKGYLQKMKDSEVDTSFCNGIIKITPLIDCEMIITNYNY